jgi:hypothetical protein
MVNARIELAEALQKHAELQAEEYAARRNCESAKIPYELGVTRSLLYTVICRLTDDQLKDLANFFEKLMDIK